LTEPAVPIDEDDNEQNFEEDVGKIPIALLDLLTSGFEANCDILQIAASVEKLHLQLMSLPVEKYRRKLLQLMV
jgi:hypothetical protein